MVENIGFNQRFGKVRRTTPQFFNYPPLRERIDLDSEKKPGLFFLGLMVAVALGAVIFFVIFKPWGWFE